MMKFLSDNQIKWAGTTTLIIGTAVNGLNIYPLGVFILILGAVFWTTAAVRAKDTALIVVNVVMALTAAAGVCYNYFK
jgi:hypothetical protein